jgi:hypothetical protein
MTIEINKDIDRYRESVALGLTARQLLYSVLSVAGGGGIVLALYGHIGLTASVYVAIPVVAPIALQGFYDFHGMTFLEVAGRKLKMAFSNRPLTYISEESETETRKWRMEEAAKAARTAKKQRKPKGKSKGAGKETPQKGR